jgi:hypothetical protein
VKMIPEELVGAMTFSTLLENHERHGNIDMAMEVFTYASLFSAYQMVKGQSWSVHTPEAEETIWKVMKTLEHRLGINETCIKVEVRT